MRAKLAMIHLWVGELDRAEAVLEGFEKTDDVGMVMAFGRLASARQRWNEARGWFERALVLDPGNANAALNLGIMRQDGPLRPDWGHGWALCRCCICGATAVAISIW